jgi:hypothetical protein
MARHWFRALKNLGQRKLENNFVSKTLCEPFLFAEFPENNRPLNHANSMLFPVDLLLDAGGLVRKKKLIFFNGNKSCTLPLI